MYAPDTVLALKEPKYIDDEGKTKPLSEYKGKKGEERPFPYNRVRVIGQSPIDHAHSGSTWEGTEAHGVIIQPLTEFSSNLDEPYGRLIRIYTVESEPDELPDQQVLAADRGFAQVPARKLPPSPEEVFRAARENPDAMPSPTRVRTPHGLEEIDPGDEKAKSPLE